MSREAAALSDAQIIAEFSDFLTMQLAIRKAREHRGISLERMDGIAGTPAAYFSKVLSPGGQRRITIDAFTLALGALGLKCLIVDDPERLEHLQSRLKRRNQSFVRNGTVHRMISRRFLSKIGRKGGKARAEKLLPKRRQAIAREAGRIGNLVRWGKAADQMKKAPALAPGRMTDLRGHP